jgi:hypothetical protein
MAQSITHGNSSGIFKNKKKKTKVQSENHWIRIVKECVFKNTIKWNSNKKFPADVQIRGGGLLCWEPRKWKWETKIK